VIDNQDQVDWFLRKLTEALPLSALATSALMAILREQSSMANITLGWKVTKVIYAGAEGGVICHLALDEEDKEGYSSCQSSILPLIAGSPVRPQDCGVPETIKHLRRDGSTDAPAAYHERQVVIAAGAPETPGAIYQWVMNMARIDLILFALFLVTTSLPLGITYTLLLARWPVEAALPGARKQKLFSQSDR
jgi:hypothetical protein